MVTRIDLGPACPDCGAIGVTTGHDGCAYPADHDDARDAGVDPNGPWGAP